MMSSAGTNRADVEQWAAPCGPQDFGSGRRTAWYTVDGRTEANGLRLECCLLHNAKIRLEVEEERASLPTCSGSNLFMSQHGCAPLPCNGPLLPRSKAGNIRIAFQARHTHPCCPSVCPVQQSVLEIQNSRFFHGSVTMCCSSIWQHASKAICPSLVLSHLTQHCTPVRP